MTIGIEDVRKIVQTRRQSVPFAGVLNKPLFILLLGNAAADMMNDVQRLTENRWADADTNLYVSSIRFISGAQEASIQETDEDCFKIEFASFDNKTVKIALTQLFREMKERVKERVNSLKDAELCIISDLADQEFNWSGACAMLFRYMIFSEEHVNCSDTKLYCLMNGRAVVTEAMEDQLKNAVGLLQQWNSELPDEPFLWKRDDVFESLESYYTRGAKIFESIMFMGHTDSQDVIYDRNGARLQMIISLLDPCSGIPNPNSSNIFSSGYVYPNQIDMGFDLTLIWSMCHAEFSKQCCNQQFIADAQAKGKKITDSYTAMQTEIAEQMVEPTNLITGQLGAESQKVKHTYLWITQLGSDSFGSVVDAWKAAARNAIASALDEEVLEEIKKALIIGYNTHSDAGNMPVLLIARIGSAENTDKINEHVKALNAWLDAQIATQKNALAQKKELIKAQTQAVANLLGQYKKILGNVGASYDEAVKNRMDDINNEPNLMKKMQELYAAQCSQQCDDDSVKVFMNAANDHLYDHGHEVLDPIILRPSKQVIGIRLINSMGSLTGSIAQIADGADRGRYYYTENIQLNNIPGLPSIQEKEQ